MTLMIRNGADALNGIVVIPRFQNEIRKHLAFSYLDGIHRPPTLGIFGRSGDGKTAQLGAVLLRLEVKVHRINAADLESGTAGEPAKLVERTYAAASTDIKNSVPAAVVIDDIDTTLGEWQENTGTVNHQQIIAALMHIADQPVNRKRGMPCRVPIFVTGNDLNKIYLPLRRAGRMSYFHWSPTEAELEEVVTQIFHGLAAPEAGRELVAAFPKEVLAFFADIRRLIVEHQFGQVITDHELGYLLRNRATIIKNIERTTHLSAEDLVAAGIHMQRLRSETLTDFTKE